MSNYATLKAAIQSAVYTNGNNEITGAGLQAVLLQIVNTVGDGYVFKGVATAGTSPGTPDANVFYVAPAGTYTNFGSEYTVPAGNVGLFCYNGTWMRYNLPTTSNAEKYIYNVSADGTTFATFSDAIASLPSSHRAGGVGFKYLDNSNVWHTYMNSNNGFSDVRPFWYEVDTYNNKNGMMNWDYDLSAMTAVYDQQVRLWGNVAYISKVNYIKVKIRNNGTNRFLSVYKITQSSVTRVCVLDVLLRYSDGTVVELPIPETQCAQGEYIAIDGPIYYSQYQVASMSRFLIEKDGTGYATSYTPIAFIAGYNEAYSKCQIERSGWIDGNVNISQASIYANLWGNVIHVPSAIGIKLKIYNQNANYQTCSVYKSDVWGAVFEKITDIDVSQYTNGSIVDIYFDECVYFRPNEYMFITSPFYFIASGLAHISRLRKDWDGSTNQASDTFIGFYPITTGEKISVGKLPLNGKRISIIGDSISAFSGLDGVSNPSYPSGNVDVKERMWYYLLEGRAGAIVNRVNAIGGAMVTGSATNQVPCCAPERYEALFSEGTTGDAPDIVFVFAGVNDWNSSYSIGDLTEDYTAAYNALTTFIPSYRKLITGLQATYPNAEVCCLTPMRSFYGTLTTKYPPTKGGHSLTEYVDAIKECASLHGARVIDLYNDILINDSSVSSILRDLLHPTLIGQTLICETIRKDYEAEH